RTVQRELPQHFPAPGRVEHDAEQILEHAQEVCRSAADGFDIAGIGITTQRETVVLWDAATGRPLHRAIVWQDRRTADVCKTLDADTVRRITGCPPDPYFSGTKMRWLLDEVKPTGDARLGTIDSWLLWKLCDVHATDPTNASRTLLWDLRERRWSEKMSALLGVPIELLPEVRPSGGAFGTTDLLGGETPVVAVIGDQQAALFGQRCTIPGTAKNTYGTGCFLLRHVGADPVDSRHQLITTATADGGFALEGSVFTGGAAVQWLRDGLGLIDTAADIEPLAASVPDTGGVVFVPALAGLGAPHWDADARGAIVGLTRGSTAAHLARATLEAIAHQTADVLAAMAQDTGEPLRTLRVDGGASANNLLMQLQADLLGVPVERPACVETTALGAARLAGQTLGIWDDGDVADATTFEPKIDASTRQRHRQQWQSAVAQCTMSSISS
ncbi:MAG: glycerol kinase GlpK, partial [Planctomycetota bacterium]